MNKCYLIGNLTRDPEKTTSASGISLCKFGIAINRQFANANGEREVDYFNIVTFRGLADNCEKFLAKGRKVGISGTIQTGSYVDKENIKRNTIDIIADDVEFLGGAASENGGAPSQEYSKPAYSGGGSKKPTSELKPVEDEGLPF